MVLWICLAIDPFPALMKQVVMLERLVHQRGWAVVSSQLGPEALSLRPVETGS